MSTTLAYGSGAGVNLVIADDGVAQYLQAAIERIVRSGSTEWLPVEGFVNGHPTVTSLLITAGVPISFIGDSLSGSHDPLRDLLTRYGVMDSGAIAPTA